MGNDQPALRAVCLRIGPFRTGNRLEHAFVILIWQKKHDKWVKWQNSHGARFAKTTANCSNSFCHFHLTLSVSWPQRSLVTDFWRLLFQPRSQERAWERGCFFSAFSPSISWYMTLKDLESPWIELALTGMNLHGRCFIYVGACRLKIACATNAQKRFGFFMLLHLANKK